MQQAGLFMIDYQRRASITDGCQKLCDELCAKDYSDPPGPSLQPQRLAKMLERVRFRNEARVVRDLTSVLVPSAELLDIDGVSPLRNICEALNAEWTQCDTLCGPRPKPDFVAGVSGSAFTNEETAKLQLSHTSASPNLFPENMYFPFLICEVKANDRPLGAAERHAMHSASLAVRALVQLYRKVSAAEELDGKVLVFSIAHDVSIIKIYGHFARIDGDTLTFFRHRLYIGDIATDLRSESSCRAHKITRAIYDVFFPQHVARVKSALSRMRGSYQLDLVDGPHESTISRSSQDDGRFKKPSFPSTTMLQQENERLHGQILEMFRIQQADDMHQREDRAKEREEEHAEWREEQAKRREEQAKRLAMMEQQFAERNEQMEQQLATQRELIALLRESKTK